MSEQNPANQDPASPKLKTTRVTAGQQKQRRKLRGKRQGQAVEPGLGGAIGDVLAATLAHHVIADMHDVGG